jgi:Co/Zn/Cd efflux system component
MPDDRQALKGNRRRVQLALVLTGVFMLVEVAGGLLSGSLALLADAGHMLTDRMALALARRTRSEASAITASRSWPRSSTA